MKRLKWTTFWIILRSIFCTASYNLIKEADNVFHYDEHERCCFSVYHTSYFLVWEKKIYTLAQQLSEPKTGKQIHYYLVLVTLVIH